MEIPGHFSAEIYNDGCGAGLAQDTPQFIRVRAFVTPTTAFKKSLNHILGLLKISFFNIP
jgi:hypothetical protein